MNFNGKPDPARMQRIRDALDQHERSTLVDDEYWASQDGTEHAFELLGRILALLDEQAELGKPLRETFVDQIKANSDELNRMRKPLVADRLEQAGYGVPTRSGHKREHHRFQIYFFDGQLKRLDARFRFVYLHVPTIALLKQIHRSKDYRQLQNQLVRPEVIELFRPKLLDFEENEPALRALRPPPPGMLAPKQLRAHRREQSYRHLAERLGWLPYRESTEWSGVERLRSTTNYDRMALDMRDLLQVLSGEIDAALNTPLDEAIDLIDSTPSSASIVRRTLNALIDDDRFSGLVGSPIERVNCLLAMRPNDWLKLIETTNRTLHTSNPGRRVVSGDVLVNSPSGIVHRGVAEPDVDDCFSELLARVQDVVRPAAENNVHAADALHRAALMINATGLIIHGLSDGNGRTFRALSYLVRSGMQLPQSQVREFELTIKSGLPGREYSGSDLGVVYKQLSELAIKQLLSPSADDFRKTSTPRKLSASKPPKSYVDLGDRTVWVMDPLEDPQFFEDGSDELLSGLGFATTYVFAKKNGYLRKATFRGPDGVPTLDQQKVLLLAYRDNKISEFVRFDRSVRRSLPSLLLGELSAPTARPSGQESLDGLLEVEGPVSKSKTLIENLELNFQNSAFAQNRTNGSVGGHDISCANTITF